MIQDLRKRMEKMQEMLTKDLELKNKQTEMNHTLEGIKTRITEAKKKINDLEELEKPTNRDEQYIRRNQ